MEGSVKQRLIEFLSYKKISQGKFEEKCGLYNGFVNNIRQSIQPAKMQLISLQYPELNTGWLMTGVGLMVSNSEGMEPSELILIIKHLNYVIAEKDARITELTDMLIAGFTQGDMPNRYLGKGTKAG